MREIKDPSDFEKLFVHYNCLTTIRVVYYMPDYSNILQEFFWQTIDQPPTFKRIHKFLNYWQYNIDAIIHSVLLSAQTKNPIVANKFHNVTDVFSLGNQQTH